MSKSLGKIDKNHKPVDGDILSPLEVGMYVNIYLQRS
jgi:hypothetical protein